MTETKEVSYIYLNYNLVYKSIYNVGPEWDCPNPRTS